MKQWSEVRGWSHSSGIHRLQVPRNLWLMNLQSNSFEDCPAPGFSWYSFERGKSFRLYLGTLITWNITGGAASTFFERQPWKWKDYWISCSYKTVLGHAYSVALSWRTYSSRRPLIFHKRWITRMKLPRAPEISLVYILMVQRYLTFNFGHGHCLCLEQSCQHLQTYG